MAAVRGAIRAMQEERLVSRALHLGAELLPAIAEIARRNIGDLVVDVRGQGLLIGVEFGPPRSLKLKAAWSMIEAVNRGLFCQLITVPLFKEHKVLSQVAGHANHTVKLLPPLVIDAADCDWIETAFDAVIADSHRMPGAAWSLGKTLADHAMKMRASAA
jgi:ornithine--oxo-acid transaminase